MAEYIIMIRFHGEPLQTLPYRNEAEARKRIASQMPCSEKAARADCVIWNDADMRTLEGEVDKVLKSLLA